VNGYINGQGGTEGTQVAFFNVPNRQRETGHGGRQKTPMESEGNALYMGECLVHRGRVGGTLVGMLEAV